MPIEILMPALSPTMTEGNLARWLKKEGDKVRPGDVIAEIETDKATMEVEAVDEGIIGKILVQEKTDNVPVNQLIALLLEEGEDTSSLTNYSNNAANDIQAPTKAEAPLQPASNSISQAVQPLISTAGDRVFASPLARRIAEQEKVELKTIDGSGPHGRIIKDDVLAALNNGPASKNLSATSAKQTTSQLTTGRIAEEYTKIPNNNMRKVIAKRLLESKQTVPHFYLSVECIVDKLLQLRTELNNSTDKDNPAFKISVNDMVIKAVALALKAVPDANASWTEEAILKYNNVDISIAVAIDGGLITPIIKNADFKSLSHISNEMKDLASRAKQNKLQPHEFQGGGFSISNLGMYGIKNFNAIINPPQSCILAVGSSSEKAIVQNGEVKIATTMEVTLSCDHRVVDGAVGANFLQAFKRHIENPLSMLI
ncbi:pyruvate dehydrogenase complex dihydrolipoamide acetyltransferase [Rickettsiales endosymbiont of Stachyamoeba lipophora]|uniref:pyruvate dehydrogenase complex dihydrolipoamide acetyltransferase n=1 Tax=Rickettsiales endosymbiont of Stachyamoeba lipophora TaxID=2486578 RepID=UPI000F64C070|nr:pyruvate dehydrogenase complex dihydrolipoamide acetyltransferase [Rickettsiales endosymbiont of Stachyamoeba lipophora]AZL16153.1 pyruvate dehydrogenase complex dihydrolipoamide acetyltransferase [Rickettsiales endosymbiont of Stachyamoeba lipophora]